MKMKAIHKYRVAASRGDREAQRRIAQSMGYKTTIHDMPKMIQLLKRGGIEIESETNDGVHTEFIVDKAPDQDKNLVGTINL